jgi:tripartite-type tricarboxylate transporter receptor subunit TctC
MNMKRRSLGMAMAAAALARPALAQAFPTRPISLVVPYGPGTATDLLARQLSERASDILGQRIVVDNRAGAGGMIGSEFVARARPDGYTLIFAANQTHATNVSLYRSIRYDPVRDFTPVARMASQPQVLVVNPRVPARTAQELVAHAKANPGRLNFGSTGIGTGAHLGGELLRSAAGIDIVHVPYNNAQVIADLLTGTVSLMFYPYLPLKPHIDSGGVIALATCGAERAPWLPAVPTMIESGFADFIVTSWFAIYGPAGLPPDVVRPVSAAFARVLGDGDLRASLAQTGTLAQYLPPEELAAFTVAEIARARGIVERSGVRLD